MNSYDKFVQSHRMRISRDCMTSNRFFISAIVKAKTETRYRYLYKDLGFRTYTSQMSNDLMVVTNIENAKRIIRKITKNNKRIINES